MTYDELMKSILTASEEMLKHGIEANSVILNGRKYGKLIENVPPNMKPTVFGMAVKADYALPDDYAFLVQYEPPKPQTNADRIRAMTDEELWHFLEGWKISLWCPHKKCGDMEDCRDCIYDWLKKEVEDG